MTTYYKAIHVIWLSVRMNWSVPLLLIQLAYFKWFQVISIVTLKFSSWFSKFFSKSNLRCLVSQTFLYHQREQLHKMKFQIEQDLFQNLGGMEFQEILED